MMNLKVSSFVVHPVFPEFGKGVITKIFNDEKSGKDIAIVWWQKPNATVHHTLSHLAPFDALSVD
jgi:hypothetical protein